MPKTDVRIARSLDEFRSQATAWRKRGERIALVPTMGALHAGHLALVSEAKKAARRVVISIFVNPKQFAAHEDLHRYPRDEVGDVGKLAPLGVDLVWAPSADVMYPDDFATSIKPDGAALGLEADIRPHHFAGVATICCKLFSQTHADVALFGEKDYQQLCVIRQMVRDLNLPIEIVGVPTVREEDGLALSSRNAYLSLHEREVAPALHRALHAIAMVAKRNGPVNKAIESARHDLIAAGFASVDYIEVRDAETLAPVDVTSNARRRVLGAARLGRTRLIDNVPV